MHRVDTGAKARNQTEETKNMFAVKPAPVIAYCEKRLQLITDKTIVQ